MDPYRPQCPVCRKLFWCDYPNQWVYKRDGVFVCSWGCLRKFDELKEERKNDMRDMRNRKAMALKVVDCIRNKQDPVEMLRDAGYLNPMQAYADLRGMMKKNMPELFKEIPDDLKKWKRAVGITSGKPDNVSPQQPGQKIPQPDKVIYPKAQETVETPEGGWTPAVQVYGAVNIETPEPEKVVVKPMKPAAFEYKVTGITTSVGNFNYWKKSGYVDWTDLNGETVSMNLEEWREFMNVIPEAMKVLGVEL